MYEKPGGGDMPALIILKAMAGDLRGQEYAINEPANFVLGRSRSCGLRLPGDPTVSRQHCLIEVDQGRAWVQDLGSLNGTHINGSKIGQRLPTFGDATMLQPARQELHHGDVLRICANVFHVEVVAPDTVSEKGNPRGSEVGTVRSHA
jgi:pSer/pThr/pTyr-binding forkhead associated (FHA) protein